MRLTKFALTPVAAFAALITLTSCSTSDGGSPIPGVLGTTEAPPISGALDQADPTTQLADPTTQQADPTNDPADPAADGAEESAEESLPINAGGFNEPEGYLGFDTSPFLRGFFAQGDPVVPSDFRPAGNGCDSPDGSSFGVVGLSVPQAWGDAIGGISTGQWLAATGQSTYRVGDGEIKLVVSLDQVPESFAIPTVRSVFGKTAGEYMAFAGVEPAALGEVTLVDTVAHTYKRVADDGYTQYLAVFEIARIPANVPSVPGMAEPPVDRLFLGVGLDVGTGAAVSDAEFSEIAGTIRALPCWVEVVVERLDLDPAQWRVGQT